MTFETKYAQLGKRVKVSAHRRKPEVKAHTRRWPGRKSRQLSFAGPSVASAGRVVIYRPRGLGKAITSYDLAVNPTMVESALTRSLQDYFRTTGGIDSYGRTNDTTTTYKYPTLESHAIKARDLAPFKGEIKGSYGEFYRFGDANNWVPASNVTELTQDAITYQISKVASDVVIKFFNDKGTDKAAVLANISQTAKDLLPMVVSALKFDPWFVKWGLKIG